ncbi:unnamed protein product [Porites evermanni]|uniref:Apple domain-containing protein n=1 Tax=Porites evermanni TaxID=104178 RepID=A0ABN8SPV5_9CNID|nr:unnamed protein product [Porites evermanni]
MENPVILRNHFFFLWIFSIVQTDSQAFSQGSIDNFFYVNFMISEFSYLNITSIERKLIQDENDCGYACLEIPSCFSYNVAAFPDRCKVKNTAHYVADALDMKTSPLCYSGI